MVSVVTTCYNGEKYLRRFLDSILNQTYRNLECIVADNASSDKTFKIMEQYSDRFKEADISYKYVRVDKNLGPASGINAAIKYVSGNYLTWPDSDDQLYENCIAEKVDYLENNKDCGLVFCQGRVVDENTNKPVGLLMRKKTDKKENIFEDLLIGRDIYFSPGCYMIRMKSFLEVNPDKEIYMKDNLTGQNHQMLLPVAYHNLCGYINKPLFNYFHREDSISRMHALDKNHMKKTYSDEDVLVNTLNSFKMRNDKAYYQNEIKKKYIRKRLAYAYKTNDFDLAEAEFADLKNTNAVKASDRVLYFGIKNKVFRVFVNFGNYTANFFLKIIRKINKIKYGIIYSDRNINKKNRMNQHMHT